MYRFKWPVKFSSPFKWLKKRFMLVGNLKTGAWAKNLSRKTAVFLGVLVLLFAVNSIFWVFRATHRNSNYGQQQGVPKLKEWQINLDEKRLDENELKKEYTIPKTDEKPGVSEEASQKNQDAGNSNSKASLTDNKSQTVKKTPQTQSTPNLKDVSAKVTPLVAVGNPSLATMAMPAVGKVIADYAVDRLIYSKTLEQWNSHRGIDIAAEEGTPVKAAMDGTVVDVKSNDPELGVVVVIDHGGDVKTLYGNLLSDKSIQKGKYVKKGQIIGAVGKTAPYEIEDPPHLHFEVLKGKENIDPEQYLPKLN